MGFMGDDFSGNSSTIGQSPISGLDQAVIEGPEAVLTFLQQYASSLGDSSCNSSSVISYLEKNGYKCRVDAAWGDDSESIARNAIGLALIQMSAGTSPCSETLGESVRACNSAGLNGLRHGL